MKHTSQGNPLHAVVIGASGYVGGELLRWLAGHPAISGITACSDNYKGQQVSEAHPFLLGMLDLEFCPTSNPQPTGDVVFFATPARVAAEKAKAYLDAGSLVVDCSPDFRLSDLDAWAHWYGGPHPEPDLVKKAVYGLVEHNRDKLAGAQLIAAPGCYATILQLATVPIAQALAQQGCDKLTIVADAASGTSGAGRSAGRHELLTAESGNNYSAYALGGHRHEPEVIQGISAKADIEIELRFVPHLLPVPRGMFASVHFLPEKKEAQIDLEAILQDSYGEERFIEVLKKGTSPQLTNVIGTNRCAIGCATDKPTVVAALDNLGKGAASQAIQAMNVAQGLDEAAGLEA